MPTTKYIWDPVHDSYLMETDAAGNTQAVYTNEPTLYGNLISQRRDNTTNYYHFDALGSTRELTDAAESVTDTNMYDAWGVNRQSTGSTENPFRFAGEVGYLRDLDLKQYYIRPRYYSPPLSRWQSTDPLKEDAVFDLYRYVNNTPSGFVDASGEYSGVAAGVAAAIAASVTACAVPQANWAHKRYAKSGDKFKHCWTSCRVAKVCGGLITQIAGLGKEGIDAVKRIIGVQKGGVGDWLDSWNDLKANQACIIPEAYTCETGATALPR